MKNRYFTLKLFVNEYYLAPSKKIPPKKQQNYYELLVKFNLDCVTHVLALWAYQSIFFYVDVEI